MKVANEFFDGNTLRRVEGMLKKGHLATLRDSQCPGLAIRVYKRKAAWALVTRDGKWTIAPLTLLPTAEHIPALRVLVATARQTINEGRKPDALFEAFRREKDAALATAHANVAHGLGSTWETVRDRYLAWATENRTSDTVRGYRSALGAVVGSVLAPDFAHMKGKPVSTITTGDLVSVRENIVARGKGGKLRQADLTVAALKACFRWYVNQKDSEITTSPAAPLSKVLETQKEGVVNADHERTFLQDEIGLLIIGFEREPNIAARNALMVQLFTGQRRITPTKARRDAFYDHPDYGMVWRINDKTNSWRVLPLTETARLAVLSAQQMTRPDNPFLFPQQRRAKMGDTTLGHMNERTVSGVIESMRLPGGILESVPFNPSTHDMRKAFTTTMTPHMHKYSLGGRALTKEDVVMVTHANEGRDTTAMAVYDKNEYLDVKLAVLREWEQWCLEGYYRMKEKHG